MRPLARNRKRHRDGCRHAPVLALDICLRDAVGSTSRHLLFRRPALADTDDRRADGWQCDEHATRACTRSPRYGDYSRPNPPAEIIDAVARQEIDLAAVWGPLAGYFAAKQRGTLALTPVSPAWDGPQSPMVFDISMAIRKGDTALKHDIDAALDRDREAIDVLLAAYQVPRLPTPGETGGHTER
jgi:hypothetical protein